MLDSIVSELASHFGLGEQAAPLAQGALAYIIKADHGGLSGFIGKFEAAGLGSMAHSWLGGPDGAQNISPAQLETVLGNKGGLISQLVASTGVPRQSVTPALGYLVPALVGALTPEGSMPASLPPEVTAFASGQTATAAGAAATQFTAATSDGVGATMLRWIPWLVLVALALGLLGWCSQSPLSQDDALAGASSTVVAADQSSASATPAAASSAAEAAAPAAVAATSAPLGAGVLAELEGDKPVLKIYFDVSRAQIAPEFASVAADLIAYLQAHPDAKVEISGFNDPTGNAVQNAKLSKQRAEAVRSALKAQGLALARMELLKPADGANASAAGANHAELRRVEVRVR